MASTHNKAVIVTQEQAIDSGLSKLLPSANIPIDGRIVKSKDARAQFQQHVATVAEVSAARAKYLQLVAAERSQRAALRPIMAGIRNHIASVFGERSPEFASFGFKPRGVATKSAETKALAVEKLRATRAARKTMGRRQKAGIHGKLEPASASVQPAPVQPAVANGANVLSQNGTSH